MENLIFLVTLSVGLTCLLTWGFRCLPDEKWQILAVTPHKKLSPDTWHGVNLTFYGLFNALAYTFGAGMMILLVSSAGLPMTGWFSLIVCILGICVPASRLIARVVEKKPATFTVAGASFAGLLFTPLIIMMLNQGMGNHMGIAIPLMPVMAALGIAYAFGEGIGRLACISFGCCYGRPLSDFPEWIQRMMVRFCFVFSGKTKKIAYAHGLDGQKVLPIQAVTSVIFCLAGMVGVLLYLYGYEHAAFLTVVSITQIWRVTSEIFRADYRGTGKISAYQWMSVLSILAAFLFVGIFPEDPSTGIHIMAGLNAMWNPVVIIFLQAIGAGIFLYTGRSTVTGANLNFFVVQDRI